MLTEQEARHEICRVGASLFARGYVHATAGNISVRLDEAAGGGFLITPTDACLGQLDPQRLARVGTDGVQTHGDRASKTLALHRAIYTAATAFDTGTRCIVHTHSTHCVALTLRLPPGPAPMPADAPPAELLPALTPYFVMKVGRVPCMDYRAPGHADTPALVCDAIARYGAEGRALRAVMLPRLGPVVWHETPAAAMAVLDELEETARLHCLGGGDTAPLEAAAIEELRRAFGARW